MEAPIYVPKYMACRVSYVYGVKPSYYILGLEDCSLGRIDPGQFVMVYIDNIETILGRPFTVYRTYEGEGKIEIFFKIVGKGTRFLSSLRIGEKVGVLGPLGKGFPIYEGKTAVLLSRGVGLSSLAMLGDALKRRSSRVITIASFRNREADLASDNEYVKSYSAEIITVYDEDGTSDLENVRLLIEKFKPDVIYTCGSKRLVKLLQKLPYPAYVSWEELMGCGVGYCKGCPVKTTTGYRLVCIDGPIFNVKDIILGH